MKKILGIIALLSIVSHLYSDEIRPMGEDPSTWSPEPRIIIGDQTTGPKGYPRRPVVGQDCRSYKCDKGFACKKDLSGKYSCVPHN